MEKLLNELIRNRMENVDKLRELLATYDEAEAGRKLQDQQVNEVYNRVLRENEFFAEDAYERIGIKVGDRITDEKEMFLLSDEDNERVYKLTKPILLAEKITDERGYYVKDWSTKSSETWVELVNFIIQKILPKRYRETFWESRFNVPKMDKLIESVRKIA